MGFLDVVFIPFDKNSDTLKNIKRSLFTNADDKREGLSIENLISLHRDGFFRKHGHIHEFLENSEIHLVTTPSEPRNQELEARIQKLKAEQENERYRQMTKGLTCTNEKQTHLRDDVKQVQSQIAAVINFVFAVVGSFFFAYKAVEYSLPEVNIPAQVLMGIITASVVALADLYFLARTI